MARWEFNFEIERSRGVPVTQQIARAIVAEIERGRLRPGDRIVGSRTLAKTLRVHRQTVVSAIDELVAEGWLISKRASGVFVARRQPDQPPRRFANVERTRGTVHQRMGIELTDAPDPELPATAPPGAILMSGTRPDVRLLPADLIGRAYRRALRTFGSALLAYAHPAGFLPLRRRLAEMLSTTRGLAVDPSSLLLTRGSQMALALAARALLKAGDVVAVEDPGYRPAWEAFKLAGARIVPIPVDEHGIDVNALERTTREAAIRAVYLTPHRQFPTTVTLTDPRRLALLQLASAARFAIVEDDYDHEFQYDGRPVVPLASIDTAGLVVYIGTWSKVLAPALRLGFVVAPPDLIERLVAYRSFLDLQGDTVLECALADLLEDGLIQRHVRKVRRIYHARRDLFVGALRRQLGAFLSFTQPSGGTAVWVRTRDARTTSQWARRARKLGVIFDEGRVFSLNDESSSGARLGFACLSDDELTVAVRRLAAASRENDR